MRRDLEHFQSGLRVHAYRYSPWSSLARWCRAHPTLVSSSAIVALSLLMGWALLAHQRALEAHRWHPVAHYDFTSLEATAAQWQGWTQTGWDNRIFHAAALAPPDYQVDGGGIVLGGKSDVVDLGCDRAVMGNVRITWTAEGLVSGQNLNCYIGGADRTKGYTLHVGGWGSESTLVLTIGERLRQLEWIRLKRPLQARHPYHLALERADRHLRLWLDGEQIMDHVDVEDPAGDAEERFGFDTYSPQQLRISAVDVYRQSPAQLVSTLVIPDQLFQLRQWDEARERYLEFAEAFPATSAATTAEFRAAQCLAAKGDAAAADAALAAFARAHGADALVPTALAQRFSYALARGDQAGEQAIFDELAGFAPNPVITGVLAERSRELAARMPTGEEVLLKPAKLAVLLAGARGYRAWWSRVGANPADDPLMLDVALALIHCGSPQLGLDLVSPGSEYQERLLIAMGRMSEAAAPPFQDGVGLMSAGKLEEVAGSERAFSHTRSMCLARLGDWQRLAAIDARSIWFMVNHLATPQDFDRAIDSIPLSRLEASFGVTTRLTMLLMRGRAAEVLRDYRSDSARAVAMCALGRFDEAIAFVPYDDVVRIACAQDALAHGRIARALELVDQRYPTAYDHFHFDSVFMPYALLYCWCGAPERARAMLTAELAVKERGEQRPWHAASYVLGRIDEAAFRAQPSQLDIATDLELCRALRCELAGDRAGADAAYGRLIAMPLWQRDSGYGTSTILRWRAELAHLPLPPAWGVMMNMS